MTKFFFAAALLLFPLLLSAQDRMVLTEDLILTSPLVIDAPTVITGNGHRIICDDCSNMIEVKSGASVHFQDVYFPRTFLRWLVVGTDASATWESDRMSGHFINRSAR